MSRSSTDGNDQIFNDSVDAYESWDLFLIFCSILVLVSGVVLLTNKKPDQPARTGPNMSGATSLATMKRARRRKGGKNPSTESVERLHPGDGDEGETTRDAVLWELGEASDDEDDAEVPLPHREVSSASDPTIGGERARMIDDHEDDDDEENRGSVSSDATLAHPAGEPTPYRDDEFGDWGETEPAKTAS